MQTIARERLWSLVIGVGLFVVALLVYNTTLTPSLSYLSPDGNELVTIAYTLGLAHSTGYPLYTWLGKLFTFIPIGDIAHRVNLMSATMGAGSVAILYGVMLIILEPLSNLPRHWRHMIAAATALLFAFSLTFWAQTGISEVYAPSAFMVSLQLLLLLHWACVEETARQRNPSSRWWQPSGRSLVWFGAFCLTFALSTGTHFSNLGFGLGYAVFVLLISWRFALSPIALGVGISAFGLGMLQHLWLPLKANALTDRLMRTHMPNTWEGFYHYTLGAFPQMKFAFTWAQVPDRVVIYLDLLRQQFSLVGVLIGIVGLWVLLIKRPRHWWLLTLMYLVHLIFFTQYRVFDLDVFFIPAHYLFAMFIGYGLYWLVVWTWQALRANARAATVGLAALLALPIGFEVWVNWPLNDRSNDTSINDFYQNAFEMLPEEAVLMGQSGVFGYDMFYWRLVYNVRPDILMPHLPAEGPTPDDLAGREVYSTIRLDSPGAQRGPGGLSPGLVSSEAWSVPVLLGGGAQGATTMHELALYHITDERPSLVVTASNPQMSIGEDLNGLTLVGYELDGSLASPGGRLHLTLYWQLDASRTARITTALGQVALETHTLGLGNLPRYLQAAQLPVGGTLVEDYWIVIPSTLDPGSYPFLVIVDSSASATLGELMVHQEAEQ